MANVAGFVICGAIIFMVGKKLSYYGEIIAELTGWGKAWVGLNLMASVTSLPELMTGVGSAAILQSADLAVGDILGSCAFNLGLFALMDVFVPEHKPIFSTASQNHVLAATLGIILITMVGFGIYLPDNVIILPTIGMTSIPIMVLYFASVRLLYKFELKKKAIAVSSHEKTDENVSLKKAVLWYSLLAVVIVGTALVLPYFAERIAGQTGLGMTFVGTLLLAVSTSLPEISVSFAAVRMGSVDLSVGNLLGSNIFNVFILALDDVWYTNGHLLKDAADINLFSVLSIILMSAIAIIGLSYRAESKRYWMAWDAALIFMVYIMNLLLLYN